MLSEREKEREMPRERHENEKLPRDKGDVKTEGLKGNQF